MGAQWKAKGKAQAADARGKLFGKLVKEITVAARLGGGDPSSNARLRMAIEAARKASMTKETLDRAVKKGSGVGSDAVNYTSVIYEGYAPHRVPVMVECLTDNPNRTAPNMRVCFRKGQMSAVAWILTMWAWSKVKPKTVQTWNWPLLRLERKTLKRAMKKA